MFFPAEYAHGDPIKAADANEENREIQRLGQERGSAHLDVRAGSGNRQIALKLPEFIFIKITAGPGANNAYTWKEVYATKPGGWTDASRTGGPSGDPAYPADGNTAVAADAKVYEAMRGATSGEWIFD